MFVSHIMSRDFAVLTGSNRETCAESYIRNLLYYLISFSWTLSKIAVSVYSHFSELSKSCSSSSAVGLSQCVWVLGIRGIRISLQLCDLDAV